MLHNLATVDTTELLARRRNLDAVSAVLVWQSSPLQQFVASAEVHMQYAKDVRSDTTASVSSTPMSWLYSALAPADVTKLMTSNERPVSPIENMLRVFTQSGNPFLNAYAQTGAELISLATRRSQALLTLPAQVVQCKTPIDVISLQIKYVQSAMQEYADSSRQVAWAWSNVTPIAAQLSRTIESTTQKQVPIPVKRDRIVIDDPKGEHAGEAEQPIAPADVRPSGGSKPRSGDRRTAA